MRYCEACNAEIPDGYDECPFCGIPATEEDTDELIEISANVIRTIEQQLDDDD